MITKCEVCKTNLKVKPYRLKRLKNNIICCSKKCSNILKKKVYLNTKNPNKKYFFDVNMFNDITEDKAYLLGWIASDGHVSKRNITIKIIKSDDGIIKKLKNIIGNIPIYYRGKYVGFNVNSLELSSNVCDILKIKPGKKSNIVSLPKFENDEYTWSFIRGYFDGDGHIKRPNVKNVPICKITSNSEKMINDLKDFVKIPCSVYKNNKCNIIEWSGVNCLDFLGKLYNNNKIALDRKKDRYIDLSLWVPSLSGKNTHGVINNIKWNKTDKNAIPPSKTRISDSGYDLCVIKKINENENYIYYNTCIKIKPPFGYYFDLISRSSLHKSGLSLANSVGVIDRSYIGEIIVVLKKEKNYKEELKLPSKIVQIIPRPIIHFEIEEVDTLDETERGEGGFGSTGV